MTLLPPARRWTLPSPARPKLRTWMDLRHKNPPTAGPGSASGALHAGPRLSRWRVNLLGSSTPPALDSKPSKHRPAEPAHGPCRAFCSHHNFTAARPAHHVEATTRYTTTLARRGNCYQDRPDRAHPPNYSPIIRTYHALTGER